MPATMGLTEVKAVVWRFRIPIVISLFVLVPGCLDGSDTAGADETVSAADDTADGGAPAPMRSAEVATGAPSDSGSEHGTNVSRTWQGTFDLEVTQARSPWVGPVAPSSTGSGNCAVWQGPLDIISGEVTMTWESDSAAWATLELAFFTSADVSGSVSGTSPLVLEIPAMTVPADGTMAVLGQAPRPGIVVGQAVQMEVAMEHLGPMGEPTTSGWSCSMG